MVREADDHGSSGVTNALLVLLQERFRQLEKMKELRQEKELLRMLSESRKRVPSPTTRCYYNQQMHSENLVSYPSKPNCQLSLSLWPDSSPERPVDSWGPPEGPASVLKQSCSADGSFVCTSRVTMDSPGSDVDTSLRL